MQVQKPCNGTSAEIEHAPALNAYYQFERPDVLELIPKDAKRVLEIGCAAGWLGNEIKRRQQCRVHGIEPNGLAAREAAKKIDKVWNVNVEDCLDVLESASFDCIVLADVLEHLIDPWAVLKKLRSKLTEGGTIVASIPNICNWNVVDALIKGDWKYQSEGVLDRTHLRFFTLRTILELFWNADLRVIEVKTTNRDIASGNTTAAALRKIDLPAESIQERGTVYQYLVVGQRLSGCEELPKVCIVILNWNNKSDTVECLHSVKGIDYKNYEVVVVDNGSTDDSAQAIRQLFPEVTVVETGRNLGYAGGNNVGLRHALETGAKWVLVLDNDAVVDPMILTRFIHAGELVPDAGVLGAKIYFYSDRNRIWHAGATGIDELGEFTPLGNGCLDTGRDFNVLTQVDYVSGCAFFVRTEWLRKIGLFEEKFFLTHEDLDWCFRAKRLGLKCIFVPDAHVWHKVSASFGGEQSPVHRYFLMRSRLVWARKNLRLAQRWRLWRKVTGELFEECVDSLSSMRWSKSSEYPYSKQVYWLIRRWMTELSENCDRPEFRAKVYGLRDYLLGRFGYEDETIRSLK